MDALALSEANATGLEGDEHPSPSAEQRSPAEGENKFQKAIAAWRGMFGSLTSLPQR